MVAARRSPRKRSTPEEGVCQTQYVDEKRVSAVQSAMPQAEIIQNVADIFSALSDPTRVRILLALSAEELCVCDLAKVADRSMGATSHQLQLLRRMRLVKYRMAGKFAYYSLANSHMESLLHEVVLQATQEAAK